MKAFLIVGMITIASTVIFIWFIRLTKQDNKKLKIVHRSDQDGTPMFV